MTANKWAVVDAVSNGADPANATFVLQFNGVPTAMLNVLYTTSPLTKKASIFTEIVFERGQESHDGAYITYLALKALYDNQTAMNERTGVPDDFAFVIDAFHFLNEPLEFGY